MTYSQSIQRELTILNRLRGVSSVTQEGYCWWGDDLDTPGLYSLYVGPATPERNRSRAVVRFSALRLSGLLKTIEHLVDLEIGFDRTA